MSQNRKYKYYDEYGQPVDEYGRAINPKTGRTYEEEANAEDSPRRPSGQYRKRAHTSNWEPQEIEERPRKPRAQRTPPRKKKAEKTRLCDKKDFGCLGADSRACHRGHLSSADAVYI